MGAAIGLAIASLVVCLLIPSLAYVMLPFLNQYLGPRHPVFTYSDGLQRRIYEAKDYLITFAVWLITFVLYPSLIFVSGALRARWRPSYTAISLLAACAFIGAFILHFGNSQFGAYDFGLLIDTGWRQIIGQRPYIDFLTPTPPGFNLGIKYAFQIFGINWNAQLYATAILATGSFLWLYWLLSRLVGRRMTAFWLAFAAEAAITLELSFWGYNSITETFVLLFFLSCLLLCQQSGFVTAQISYYFSLWLLTLMKPNMAGTLGLSGIVLVLCATDRKMRVTLLTLAAAATAPLFLYLNGVSIPSMLGSYRAAAVEHGVTLFGLRFYNLAELAVLFVWTLILALPIAIALPACRSSIRQRHWRKLAFQLFFPAIFVITCYGLITNSDCADVQLASLLVGSTLMLFGIGLTTPRPLLRRVYASLLFAMLASDLYTGAMRWRVYGIGVHQFFEWKDADHRVNSQFFADLRASPSMSAVVAQISQAISDNQGPYFLGPRLEMGYALNRLASPDRMAVLWEPGTIFARKDQEKLIRIWQEHKFKTLIFLKDDYTFYTPEFLSLIHSNYIRDDRYSELTVYHSRAP